MLEAKLEKLLGAEHAEKRKGALHAKVMAMMMKTQGLMGKSPQEVQIMYAKMKQKLLDDRLELSGLVSQLEEVHKHTESDSEKIKQEEERIAAEKEAAEAQRAKDEAAIEAEMAKIDREKGETEEQFQERKR